MDKIGCFGHSIGPFGPKQTQSGPFGLIRPPETCWLVDLLTRRLVDLTWGQKKGPYSHEPGTFEFYE